MHIKSTFGMIARGLKKLAAFVFARVRGDNTVGEGDDVAASSARAQKQKARTDGGAWWV